MSILQTKLYSSIEDAVRNPKRVQRLQLFSKDGSCGRSCPSQLAQFVNLEELHIGWCSDKELPSEIQDLPRLKTLIFLNTRIGFLPDWLFSCCQLRQLAIRGSDIQAMPDGIQELSELHSLEFGNNGLKTVPAVLGSLHKLKHLRLPDNHLADLPFEISSLSNLLELGLAGNAFSKHNADKIKAWFHTGVVCL